MASLYDLLGAIKPAQAPAQVSQDEFLAKAQANAEKREKLAELKSKLDNLKAQKKELMAKQDSIKSEQQKLTDDEIVRMAKVKGIKDSDIQSYINGRITQRNADMEKNRADMMDSQNKAMDKANRTAEEAEKSRKLEELTNEIYGLEERITSNSVTIATGNKGEKKVAMATARTLSNQYDKACQRYKELTGKEWESNIDDEDNPAPAENPADAESDITLDSVEVMPEGYELLDEVQKASYEANKADKDAQNKILAEAIAADRKKKEGERKKSAQVAEDTKVGQSTVSSLTAKNKAMAVARASNGKKTWLQLMNEWGWVQKNNRWVKEGK